MAKRILAFLLVIVMAFSLFACKEEETPETEEKQKEIKPTPVLATDNFEVSISMVTYFFNGYYRNFVNQNEGSLASIGLDPTKPLDEQKYSEEYSWFDYFCFYIADQMKRQIVMAEAAKADGYTLSDDDIAYIEGELDKIEAVAGQSDTSTTYYITTYYGSCVNEYTIRRCLELGQYAKYYSGKLLDSYSFETDEIEAYFEKNAKDILSFNYIRYQVESEDQDKVVNDFSACETEADFVELIKKYASEGVYDADEEYLSETIESCYIYGAAYNENSEFAKWAFDDVRKAYDIYISKIDDGKTTLVAMALPVSGEAYKDSEVLWRDITPLHNVNSIRFLADDYETDAMAKQEAEKVFEEYKNGTAFADLVKKHNGGPTSNIIRGSIPAAVDAWIFDEARKVGEIGLVTEKNGDAYIIEMKEDGMATWEYYVVNALSDATYDADIEALQKKYELGYNSEGFAEITPVTMAKKSN